MCQLNSEVLNPMPFETYAVTQEIWDVPLSYTISAIEYLKN